MKCDHIQTIYIYCPYRAQTRPYSFSTEDCWTLIPVLVKTHLRVEWVVYTGFGCLGLVSVCLWRSEVWQDTTKSDRQTIVKRQSTFFLLPFFFRTTRVLLHHGRHKKDELFLVKQANKEGHFVDQTANMHKQAVLLMCCITLVMCVVDLSMNNI